MGGGIPLQNVNSQTASWGGVNSTRSFTYSKMIDLFIVCRSGDSTYSIYKNNGDGTFTRIKYGTSGAIAVTFSADCKTATVTSSWGSSALYFIIAITTDNVGEVDYEIDT